MAWLGDKLKAGLAKTRKGFLSRLEDILPHGRSVDTDLLEDLEDALLGADVGLSTAEELLERVKESAKRSVTADDLREMLRRELLDVLSVRGSGSAAAGAERPQAGARVPERREQGRRPPDRLPQGSAEEPLLTGRTQQTPADKPQFPIEILQGAVPTQQPSEQKPQVILVVGVNGAGKTTTIGKLAWRWASQGKKVMVAASDTFRAGAVEQLDQWIKRAGGEIVQQQRGADPAAVAFDALHAAKARGCDYLLVDTAGRLHTKANLMEELKKIGRVLGRLSPGAPHRVLLVLDATAGQNALIQAREFGEATGVTGIVIAKLDGTARGGAVIAIARELSVPVEMLGVGEGPEDLTDFDPESFVDALLAP